MSTSNLEESYQQYQAAQQAIVERQTAWQSEVKDFIKDTLQALQEEHNIAGKIKEEDKITNIEAIYLDMGQSTTEIKVTDAEEPKQVKRSEGSLMYSQLYNGKISVWIRYPKIKKLMKRKAPKIIEVYEPKDLSTADITEHLQLFFQELTDWMNQDKTQTRPIGF